MLLINLSATILKRTVRLFSSDHSCKDGNTRLTTVSLETFICTIISSVLFFQDSNILFCKALRIELWIGHCYLCMNGNLKTSVSDPYQDPRIRIRDDGSGSWLWYGSGSEVTFDSVNTLYIWHLRHVSICRWVILKLKMSSLLLYKCKH